MGWISLYASVATATGKNSTRDLKISRLLLNVYLRSKNKPALKMNTQPRITYLLLFLFVFGLTQMRVIAASTEMPEFKNNNHDEWFNSKPLKRADLKGKVLLIDVWTYGCWNCYRSFPWLIELERKFSPDTFQVIGIHTPEFDHEKTISNVEKNIKKFKLHHPVMMDNDFSYWKALNNRYWPSFYIIDKKGQIRFKHVGETHSGDRNAVNIESEIRQLLLEK